MNNNGLARFGNGSDIFEVIKFFVLPVLSICFSEMLMDRFSLRDQIGETCVLRFVTFYAQFGILVIPLLMAYTISNEFIDSIIIVLIILCFFLRYSVRLNYSYEALRKFPGSDYFTYFR